MSRPAPTVTIDLTPVYTAIDAVQHNVDTANVALLSVMERLTKLETPVVVVPIHPIPQLAKWEADTKQFADIHGAKFFDQALDGPTRLGLCYYDAAWIYRSLANYLNHPDYLKVRDEAIKIYRDGYVMAQPEPGKVAGWMIFPHGLYLHYADTGDEQSKQAVLLMADHAAFASMGEIINYLPPLSTSREAAYNLMAKLYARDLGGSPVGIEELKDICLGHLAKWRAILDGTNAAPYSVNDSWLEDCRPFMVGLTCQALIEYIARTADAAVQSAIRQTLELMWEKMYVEGGKALQYTDRDIPGVGNTAPAPDVNMLIAPAYAWIGQRERADLLFEGSVMGAYLTGDKQFNQANRWVWDYFTWRNA